MDASKLLDNLAKDLAELAVPKKAHIQIERILQAYQQQVAQDEAEVS